MIAALLRAITGTDGLPEPSVARSIMTASDAYQAIGDAQFSSTIETQAIARLGRRLARGESPSEALMPVMAWANENDETP